MEEASLARAAEILIGDSLALRAGDEVLITADPATDANVTTALVRAAERLGAKAAVMMLARLPYQGALADPYLPASLEGAAGRAQIWIDLTFPYIAGAKLHDRVLAANGSRYLLLGDVDREAFVRLYAAADFDRYFAAQAAFDQVFQAAIGKSCRITDGRGSDVRFTLAASTLKKPRRAETPGMYLVPGTCSIAPDIATVQGTIVIGAVFHEYYETLPDPIRIEVDGKIRRVTGGGGSGVIFARALERAAGTEMGSIIHFSHGLHPAARFTGKSFIEDIRVVGNDAVGFGLPWWEPGGGENHPDGVMMAHSVWIEDREIIAHGRIIWPEALARTAAELTSRAAAG